MQPNKTGGGRNAGRKEINEPDQPIHTDCSFLGEDHVSPIEAIKRLKLCKLRNNVR